MTCEAFRFGCPGPCAGCPDNEDEVKDVNLCDDCARADNDGPICPQEADECVEHRPTTEKNNK
jgi:hypothetical protein